MTIINNIEIDDIPYDINNTLEAIQNNDPVDDVLHVIIVISNPCLYATRYILAKQFIKRMETVKHIQLYCVELAFGDEKFYITDPTNSQHLQLRTSSAPLWHKENMINIGVRTLLPKGWRAMAWIDADVEFENASWALDALKLLNGYKDVIQLFSHAVDMDKQENTMRVFTAFGYQYEKQRQYTSQGADFWHPGYAWACTHKAYDRMGGIFDKSILGSGDHNMALSFIKRGIKSINNDCHDNYKRLVMEFEGRCRGMRLGYCPGVLRHYYHGSKQNRKYSERWQILVKHQYDPLLHVKYNSYGLLVPRHECPKELLDDIFQYFAERNEDEA
jgi:hypothetical protein